MDTRIALKNETELKFYNSDNGICTYTIQKELARGASCIVYDALYVNNSGVKKSVRIKECYPFKLTITRAKDNALYPTESDRIVFEEQKEKMCQAFDLGNELFSTSGLTNFTTNTVDIYRQNNTVYIVTTYQEGDTISYDTFSSLKDCIAIVKSTAKVIAKIHYKGYLYLDIKPKNIFWLTGTKDVVQLFDFDSLVPISFQSKECEYKILYTKGFSALELQMGNQKRIGKHSDIYSIGAILFYLIFGTIPTALDCEMDAEYEYANSKYAVKSFQDKLYFELTDFFHNTLANYYLDRYQDMQEVITKLEKLEQLADTTIPFIRNSYIPCPKLLIGREEERKQLDHWLEQEERNALIVSGMGGIGKSSFVRSYLTENAQKFDVVLLLNFRHSLKETIIDEKQFSIHTIEKNEQEDNDDYFDRKLNVARKLIYKQQAVLVIDNFDGEDFDGIDEILKLNWKVIFITRKNLQFSEYDSIPINAIKGKENLYYLIESHLRRPIETEEYFYIDEMIESVQRHTLVLELIAKQIANSFLTIQEASVLMKENGFSSIASEKVQYTKDFVAFNDTIKNIIDKIFVSVSMIEEKKTVLKAISYFGVGGIEVNLFANLCNLNSKDSINELMAEGWISVENRIISMHPVIGETVHSWQLTKKFHEVINHILIKLNKFLCAGEKETKKLYLQLSEEFLNSCAKESNITTQFIYRELLFSTATNMPRYREDDTLIMAKQFAQNSDGFDGTQLIKIYDMISEIYEEQGELDKSYQSLMELYEKVKILQDNHITGQYYDMLSRYYDCKLDGFYETTDKEQKRLYKQLISVTDKAIKYMKKSHHTDKNKLLGEYIRAKANFLIRNNPKKKSEIKRLLSIVKNIIAEDSLENTLLGCAYHLTLAWYFTYVEPNLNQVTQSLQKAYEIEMEICENELDMIDIIFVPSANILLENGHGEESAEWLLKGIRVCEENEEIVPYIRKKMELYQYLLDVYDYCKNEEKYKEIFEIAKGEMKKYQHLGITIDL